MADNNFRVKNGLEVGGVLVINSSGELQVSPNTGYNNTNWDTAYSWGDHSTQSYATQSYVGTAISNLVDSSPATLDTLNELAAALGDDPNFATTVSNSIGTKWTQDNTKISNWDTAYGWGDHSTAGYDTLSGDTTLSGFKTFTSSQGIKYSGTAASPLWLSRSGTNVNIRLSSSSGTTYVGQGLTAGTLRVGTTADLQGAGNEVWHYGNLPTTSVANWNTAYSWGDHASAGYFLASNYTNVFKSGSEIAGSQDLNNYRTTGYYSQDSNADATSGSNYPINAAGILEVITGDQGNGFQTEQRYSQYNTNDKYVRHYYNGTWTAWAEQWNSSSDGAGSGLDADLLDGQQGSYYAPNSSLGNYLPLAGGTVTGSSYFTGGAGTVPALHIKSGGNSWSEGVAIHPASDNAYALTLYRTKASFTDQAGTWAVGNLGQAGAINYFGILRNGLTGGVGARGDSVFDISPSGIFRFGFNPIVGSSVIWHAGNDGSGSGLDADLLDGQHGSYYAPNSSLGNYLPLTGGTVSGTLTLDNGGSSTTSLVMKGTSPTISLLDDDTNADDFYIHVNSNRFYILANRTDAEVDLVGTGWETPHPMYLDSAANTGYLFDQRMFSDSYHPNADTWTTARTLGVTLTGDVTGSATMSVNGGSNQTATITTVVADDSHNHSNYLPIGGKAADSELLDGVDSTRVIYGSNSSGTNQGTIADWNAISKTGFYSKDSATNRWLSAVNWSSVLHFKLYDNNNSYSSQMGFNTYDNRMYARTNNGGVWTGWDEFWTSGNDGSGSGLDADLLDGQHGSYYAPNSSLGNYLPLAGGTLTGTLAMGANAITSTGTISSGAITATGNSIVLGVGSTGDAFQVFRGSDGAGAFRVMNTGEVVVSSNYFYVDASQGSYFSSFVRFRGTISNDTGTDVTIGDTLNVTEGIKLNGTTVIDSSRNLTNIGTISSGAITSTGAITSADFFKATGGNLKFSAGGNHIFNVDLNGKIYPQTHNAVDIGFNNTTAFRNLYLSGTVNSTSGNYTTTTAANTFTTQYGNIQLGPMNTTWAHIYTDRPAFYFNKEMRVNNNLVWNAGNDGSESGLDADLLDGQQGSYYLDWTNVTNKPDPNIAVTLTGDVTGSASATLTDLASGSISIATTVAPNSVALGTDTTGNYAGAVVAGNAITVSGTAGEGTSFTVNHADTSSVANLSSDNANGVVLQDIALTFDTYGHVTGATAATTDLNGRYWQNNIGTLNVNATVDGSGSNPFDDAHTETRVTGSGAYLLSYTNASAHMISSYVGGSASVFQMGAHYNGDDFYMRTRTDNSTWQPWRKLFHENYHPNADKWTTARTISLTGDVTGSTTIDGSANVSITTTVGDNSHNHTSLTGVTSIGFAAQSTDGASITTTIGTSETYFDFNLSDDNNNDWWRWRFTPSGSTVYDAMTLKPVANGYADLALSGAMSLRGSVSYDDVSRYWLNTATNWGIYWDTTDNRIEFHGAGTDRWGVDLDDGTQVMAGDLYVNGNNVFTAGADDRCKYSVWTGTYGIGMGNSYTYGGLNGYAMTFQMDITANRGWWWGTNGNSNAQGAMALTIDGRATIASGMRIGYGTTDTTSPTANVVDISGTLVTSSTVKIGGTNATSSESVLIQFQAGGGSDYLGSIRTYNAGGYNQHTRFYTSNVTGTPETFAFCYDHNGNVGINTLTPAYKLEVNGSFAATTKSFVIDHPTKEDMKLRYGSLEGPENGVYVRGRLKDSNVIELPDYWTGLVHEDSITVSLTAIGKSQELYVIDINDNKITVGSDENINCFYTVFAERKDVEKLKVEYK